MNASTTTAGAGPITASSPSAAGRLISLDGLRGLIMVLMAVDHASSFIARTHSSEFWGMALPDYPDGLSFFTRAVTHLCAPGFFFLMGAGMALFAASRASRGWSDGRIMRFFVSRGALLIVLQLFVENPAWIIGALTTAEGAGISRGGIPGVGGPPVFHLGVLYGLGSTMILLGLLLRARAAVLVLISVAAILATQMLTPSAAEAGTAFPALIRMLMVPGLTGLVQVFYPTLPWLGLAGLGVVFGKALVEDRQRPLRLALPVGLALLALFIALRAFGGFGNLHAVPDGWIGFLNVTKYPPSLTFITLTLGVDLLLLHAFWRMGQRLEAARPLLVFGRTALFFYVLHLYLYAAIGLFFPAGMSLPAMYPFWLLGLVLLYPACVWYMRFKATRPADSVWRLF